MFAVRNIFQVLKIMLHIFMLEAVAAFVVESCCYQEVVRSALFYFISFFFFFFFLVHFQFLKFDAHHVGCLAW